MSLEPRSIPSKSNEPLFLTTSALDRIKGLIEEDTRKSEWSKACADEAKRLKEISKKMVDGWSNTFAGYHKQRLEAVKQRRINEEIARVQVDMLEEKIQGDKQKIVLDQAYRRLYEQTDRVKRLKAARNFAEVLKERETQGEIKKRAEAVFGKFDADYMKCVLRDIDNHEDDKKEGIEREKMNKLKNAENWSKQIGEVKKRREKERQEEYRLGYIINDEAVRYAKEEEQRKLEQKQIKREFKEGLDRETKEKRELADIRKVMEDADEKRAQIFQDAKRKMALIHKENQKENERQREEKAAKMREILMNRTIKRQHKEEDNLKKAILEREADLEEKERVKAARLEEAQEDIQKFYESKLKAKEEFEVADRRRKFQERRGLEELAEELKSIEDAKKEKWARGEREGQHVQLHQIAKKNQDKKALDLSEMTDYMRHMRSLDDEEEFFQKYAKMQIEECEAKGVDTYPMRKAAEPGIECGKGPLLKDRASVRPKCYGAAVDAGELHVVKRIGGKGDTKSRLGFTH